MTRRKRTDPPPLSDTDTPRVGARLRTTEPGDDGRQQVNHPDVEMAAPTTEEPPTVQLESSSLFCSGLGANQVELADPLAPSSELVKDTLSYEESEELDRQIRFEITPWTKDRKEEDRADTRPLIVKKIVRRYSVLDRKYVEDCNEVGKLLNNNTWLLPILDNCWEKGEFCMVRRLSESSVFLYCDISLACGNLCFNYFRDPAACHSSTFSISSSRNLAIRSRQVLVFNPLYCLSLMLP